MSKLIALKAFQGVRRGQVLDPKNDPTLTPARVEQLKRNRLVEGYRDGMAAAPAGRASDDPAGVTSPNAAGLVELGWNPSAAHENRVRAIGEGEDLGNESGIHPANVPDGISTSEVAPPLSSPAVQARRAPTLAASSGERPKRGRRPKS